ncbi:MAG: helix-turn-helix domain-containing protein [bacterium]|nr:helix-turn-helix domain-containing protein [bacterium]
MSRRERRAAPEVAAIGHRLRKLRKEQRLTQSELARQIGIQQSDLSRMEKGEYRVSLDHLFRILAVFGLGIAEFFGDAQTATAPVTEPLSHLDMQTMQLMRRLSPSARDEVREFLEFKLRKEQVDRRSRVTKREHSSG